MKNIPEYKFKRTKENTLILKASEIETIASDFIKEYSAFNSDYSLLSLKPTPIENIIENYCDIQTDYQTFTEPFTLGMTTFSSGNIKIIKDGKIVIYPVDKGTIIISNELAEDSKQKGRYNYTLAHELGHNIFHRILFEEPDYSNQPLLFDIKPVSIQAITCHRDNIENLNTKNWTEWQADYFASCLLMPKEAVAEFWKPYIKESEFIFGENPKPLLHNMQEEERYSKLEEFIKTFQVSKQAAKIRLEKLNYIERRYSL